MENQIELDYEGRDQDPEEIEVVDNLKLVDVMHILEQIGDFFFLLYIFWHVQIMKNHVLSYNFSCVNVCEIRICYLLHLFIRYTMCHFLYWK